MVERQPAWAKALIVTFGLLGLAGLAALLWPEDRSGPVDVLEVRMVTETEMAVGVGACHPSLVAVDVLESQAQVVLTLTAEGDSRDADCADGITIDLDEPLGVRAVVDERTGRALDCGVGPEGTTSCYPIQRRDGTDGTD